MLPAVKARVLEGQILCFHPDWSNSLVHSCFMLDEKEKGYPPASHRKRYVYLEAPANATTTAVVNIENNIRRYPETEGTPRHLMIFSSLFSRNWNIPQLYQAVCSSASFTCIFLTPDSYLSSCSSGSSILAISTTDSDRTAEAKHLRVS